MYPRSFPCEEAKIKQRTPLKKELCEIFVLKNGVLLDVIFNAMY